MAPAWLASPRRTIRSSWGAAIHVTTPIVSPLASSTPPCSTWEADEGVHGRRIDPRLADAIGIGADGAHCLGRTHPVAVDEPVESRRGHLTDHRPAAQAAGDEARLFTGDAENLDRAPRPDPPLAQYLHRLDPADHAEHAVVGTGVQRGVEVGAGEDRRRVRITALPAPDQIAGRVQADVEPGRPHQLGDVLGARLVLRRVHLAGDPACVRIRVERREPGDRRMHPRVRLRGGGQVRRRSRIPCRHGVAAGHVRAPVTPGS